MYSDDFRALAVRLIIEQRWSYQQVASMLRVGKGTVHRWVNPSPSRLKQPRAQADAAFSTDALAALADFIAQEPCTTQARLQVLMKQRGHPCGRKKLAAGIRMLGITKKRTSKRTGPRTSDDASAAYHILMSECFDTVNKIVVSVDECYFSERVLPLTGFSKAGSKCVVATNTGGWMQRSLLLAVASDGTKQFELFHGAVNKQRFTRFILSLPYPPGSVVILDNVSFHKCSTPFVAKAYKKIHTPPYSPEDNCPVENAFSKIKGRFRSFWPWPLGVDGSVRSAVSCLTAGDILGSFAHLRQRCDARESRNPRFAA